MNYDPLFIAAELFKTATDELDVYFEKNICNGCGHMKDHHIGQEKINNKGYPVWRGTKGCTELVQTGGHRSAPKLCPCEGFERQIPLYRTEYLGK